MMKMPYEVAKEMMDMFVALSIYATGHCPSTLEEIAASEEYAKQAFLDVVGAWESEDQKWEFTSSEDEDCSCDYEECCWDCEDDEDCDCDCESHEEAPAATIDNPNFNEEQFQKSIEDVLSMLLSPSRLKS